MEHLLMLQPALLHRHRKNHVASAARLIVAYHEVNGAFSRGNLERTLELKTRLFDLCYLIWLELTAGPFVHGADFLTGRIHGFSNQAYIN